MKLIAAICLTMFAASSWACPNLVGKYSCDNASFGEVNMDFSQAVANGITTYTVTTDSRSNSFPADNVAYPFEDKAHGVSGSTRSICENESLNIYSKLEVKDASGETETTADVLESVSLDLEKNIQIHTTGSQTHYGETSTIEEYTNCVRN